MDSDEVETISATQAAGEAVVKEAEESLLEMKREELREKEKAKKYYTKEGVKARVAAQESPQRVVSFRKEDDDGEEEKDEIVKEIKIKLLNPTKKKTTHSPPG